jgi:hypothetical protein
MMNIVDFSKAYFHDNSKLQSQQEEGIKLREYYKSKASVKSG